MGRLVVVEDDADLRFLTRRALEADGHTVLEAASGREALDLLQSEKLDGVLLDITLGDMEGMAVLRRIRARPELDGLPVVMISGHASKETIEEAEELGCSAYLTKPVGYDKLRSTMNDLLA